MLLRGATFFFLICLCDNIHGAAFNSDSLKAEKYFENGKFDSALYFFQRWESRIKLVNSLAYCETSIAHIYQVLGNQIESEKYLLKATSRFNRVSNPASLKSKIHEIRGRNSDYNSRDFQKAREQYTLAFRYSEEAGLPPRSHAIIHFLIGRTFLFTGDFREAESRFNQALSILEKDDTQGITDLFEVYNTLATMNRRMLNMEKAMAFYRKAEALWRTSGKSKMHPNYGLLLYGMGNLFLETGAYHDAIEYYSNALMVFRDTYGERNMRTAVTYMNIGAAKGNQLDYYGAIEYYTKALDSYQEILPPDHPFISSAYIDFCDSYQKMGRYEEALASGRKAIEILESRYGEKENRELGIALYHTADVLLKMQRGSEALPLISRSISIFRRSDEKYLLNIVLTIKGQVLKSLEKYAEAETCFETAAAVFSSAAMHNLHLAQTFTSHASLKLVTGHHVEALDLCSRALQQLGIITSGPYDVFPVRTSFSIDFISSLLAVRAEALWNLYQKNGDHSILRSALENYDLLAEAYERVVMESKAERSKLNQTARVASACEKAIACALEMHRLTRNEEFKIRAFGFSERSRAIILSQFVHDSRARQFAGIPEDLLSKEMRLKEKITFREKELADVLRQNDVDDSARVAVHHELISARMRYDSLLEALKRNYPAYHALRYHSGRPDLRKIQQSMDMDDGILEYMLGDSAAYVFVATRNSIDVVPLNNVPQVNRYVRNLISAISEKDPETFLKYSPLLYSHIFGSADVLLQKNQVKDLLIVPDGSLSYVPFECLISTSVAAESAYLLQRYSIRYGFTAARATTRHESKTASKESSIGFAPVFASKLINVDSTTAQFSLLPYSKTEVDKLSQLYNGVAMYGQDATETTFRRMASDYAIIHLATHAIADDEHPDESRLYFANEMDSLHDGFLHAYELLNMSLSSQLVTLSACNTGAGSLHRGEGVMSLSRAFAFAGCPSIMTSLWQAQDLSTSRIMESFYKNLATGMSKSQALREAKLKYLSESDKVKSLPFFWAGLVIIGADDPIAAESRMSLLGVWAAGLLLMAVLLYIGIKTKALPRVITKR